MSLVYFAGVALGFVGAIMATAFLARRIVAAMAPKGPEGTLQRRTIVKGATAGAVIGFGPALLLGTVIGATLGGNYGGALAQGARDSGALAGAMLGVFAVATLLLSASVWLGAWVARRIALLLAREEMDQ